LYGQYLNQTDTAIALLEEVLQLPNPDVRFINETKIMLGDMYLLKGEPWESTLLYSQVEKALKDQPLAHEAKLKNAKLSYYKGEFELAQEHLDILKMATSREIANDAMELSLLISDNTILDTSTAAMEEYAAIELLLFKNQDDEALKRLDKMLVDFPNHSLTDEIYFLQGKIFQKRKDFQAAIAAYEKVEAQKGIYSDDALFLQAQLYDFQFKNKEKAMELYQRILKDFQGSIYVVEARKRFRTLRGDANIPN
jgi:tetratricopeptide (TPR) repeat protein